ncbi:hypothetical protein [Alteraurantiacibacter buctensis]|uniref:Uncharacterized protein n=1 Tax=Alteraurantiacibacter buctensis TaxID=1503981 RepID=A0A844Z0U7_9SPHN|nr:hypothetical protein [Alteraurantiacibacter buctensis]MXO72886.1 hypothetical protein [Alteraurantiacibacter buctensis]
MSRIRSIHPGIWTDEQFVSLSSFARLLFIGIWNECDDKGLFPWSPLQMKMRVLPADNVDAVALMAELEANGCIRKYEIGGKSYGAVRNFAKFQRPKAPNDIHPATDEILVFAGHSLDKSTKASEPLPNDFPNPSEKSPQMEDGEEEIKEKIETNVSCASGDAPLTVEEVVEGWNTTAASLGLAQIRKLTPVRRKKAQAQVRRFALEEWQSVFAKISQSPFLLGQTGGWRCDFDFILSENNFVKILEGKYDRQSPGSRH